MCNTHLSLQRNCLLDTVESIEHIRGEYLKLPIDSFVNIFVLGDSGAGKTTFNTVIVDRTYESYLTISKYKWFGGPKVIPYTAGIIPKIIKHSELGSVILHDFAGQCDYYDSHSALLEELIQNFGAVFLLFINLTGRMHERSKYM